MPAIQKQELVHFESQKSKYRLEAKSPKGGPLCVSATQFRAATGETVVFLGLRNRMPRNCVLLIAVNWDRRTILGTACGRSESQAIGLLKDDLSRRGWRLV
jgi:hypothetical protein